MTEPDPIVAAGAVVTRKGRSGPEVLLVHRPKYDDWSIPKGKLDPFEHVTTAAVREVAEETGIDIRLGVPLPVQTYDIRNGRTRVKHVHYWVGRPVGGDDVTGFAPNDEVDEVVWLGVAEARRRLTYAHEVALLDDFVAERRKTHALVILRHSKALSRSGWDGDDRERPLTPTGEFQSEQLVPILSAYGVGRVVSSTSRRCWTTVAPYADVADLDVEVTKELSEEDADAGTVADVVASLLAAKDSAVLCTHRPVLPFVWEALGIEPAPLEPGSLVVVHHRRGKVVTVELHAAPPDV